jgi:ABC-type uncharacterized transport system ATPase subunit
VLKALDLEIPRGQKIAIIGPSGSGKSTILRILMTLEAVEAGSVRVGEQFLWRGDRESTQKADDRTTGRRAPAPWHGVPAIQPVSAHDRATERRGGSDQGARQAERCG